MAEHLSRRGKFTTLPQPICAAGAGGGGCTSLRLHHSYIPGGAVDMPSSMHLVPASGAAGAGAAGGTYAGRSKGKQVSFLGPCPSFFHADQCISSSSTWHTTRH